MVYLNNSLWKIILALTVVFLFEETRSSPRETIEKRIIRIAGIFNEGEEEDAIAFNTAVSQINLGRLLIPGVTLEAVIEWISPPDSFTTAKREYEEGENSHVCVLAVCNLTANHVAAIFGPSDPESAGIVQSLCDTMNIPHFRTNWNFPGDITAEGQFNMYPNPELISKALVDILEDMGWKSFTIIYENEESLERLQEVLKSHTPSDLPITVRQLGPDNDYRPLLKKIHNSSETQVILDVGTDKILQVLQQASEVKMLDRYHSYFVTSLDADTLDLTIFDNTRGNISGIRFLDPQAFDVQSAAQDFMHMANKPEYFRYDLKISPETLTVSTALMYDAVYFFADSLKKVDTDESVETESLTCDEPIHWKYGNKLIEYMKIASYPGVTGLINFNGTNYRDDFTLELLELQSRTKRGSWKMNAIPNRINLSRTDEQMKTEQGHNIANQTLKVVSRKGLPYFDEKINSAELKGNDKYEGFAVDLINEIAKRLNFTPEFYVVKEYGIFNPVLNKWEGIIGELISRDADLGICDLTITSDREKLVDFTMPFMHLGISILTKTPEEEETDLFSFLKPFQLEVWFYVATAYMGVSVLMFFLARISPYEWDNPHPCNPEPEELENTFNLLNSLWFCNGSIMQQGCDFLPKAVSTRIVAGMWWFFTLIMVSSYTANLAAFLTTGRMGDEITSAEDLAKQTTVKYGCLSRGSTKAFFQNSNFSTYQRMWATMESDPSVFMQTNSDGVKKVLNDKNYAFLMESTTIEYEIAQECDKLQMVGGRLDSKGYGIAFPVNSPYRAPISGVVLDLQEKGILKKLKAGWWKKRDGEECAVAATSDADANELGLKNVGGVFVVLIAGCSVSFLLSIMEFLWNLRKVAVEEKITPKKALNLELKFAIRCQGTTKPVHRKMSETPKSNISRSLMRLNILQKSDNDIK